MKDVIDMFEMKNGKYFFGTVRVGERGQIVIPKEARDKFNIRQVTPYLYSVTNKNKELLS